jgi:hypothetical protein
MPKGSEFRENNPTCVWEPHKTRAIGLVKMPKMTKSGIRPAALHWLWPAMREDTGVLLILEMGVASDATIWLKIDFFVQFHVSRPIKLSGKLLKANQSCCACEKKVVSRRFFGGLKCPSCVIKHMFIVISLGLHPFPVVQVLALRSWLKLWHVAPASQTRFE